MRRASKFAAGWNTSVEPAANRLPRRSNPLPRHPKAWLAIAMAWAAAFVDVVGWLVLYHVFTAHMTGNTASFGIDVAERDSTHAFHQSWPLVPFLVGLIYGASTSAAARRLRWHSSFAIALVTELVLLGLFISFGTRYSIDGELRSPSPLMRHLFGYGTAGKGQENALAVEAIGRMRADSSVAGYFPGAR